MPGVLKKPEQALVLSSDPDPGPGDRPPRQPFDLEGLLRFAVEATRREDAPDGSSNFSPMDEEKRRFLEDALKSMTIDVIEVLVRQIKAFDRLREVTSDEDNVEDFLRAFGTICDYIDDIDIANDFYKIGGFSIIGPCLRCPNATIRLKGADLLAELCQNNSFCQNVAIDNGFLEILIPMLEDPNFGVVAKVIYATGCVVRENPAGLRLFESLRGFEGLKEPLINMDERTRKKASFLLVALCNMDPTMKDKLISLDFVNEIVTILMREPHEPSFEDCGALLLTLVEGNESGISVCKGHEEFEDYLRRHVEFTDGKDEFLEANATYRSLLRLVFAA